LPQTYCHEAKLNGFLFTPVTIFYSKSSDVIANVRIISKIFIHITFTKQGRGEDYQYFPFSIVAAMLKKDTVFKTAFCAL
jgi:hypothetical protein